MKRLLILIISILILSGCISRQDELNAYIVKVYREGYTDGINYVENKEKQICDKTIEALKELEEDYLYGRKK